MATRASSNMTRRKVREWGTQGNGPGEFDLPHGIVVRSDDNVYVADRENGRIEWLTPEGKYLGEWGMYPTPA